MDKTGACYAQFKVERDPFCLEADLAEGVEDRWWKLAEQCVNENTQIRYQNIFQCLFNNA